MAGAALACALGTPGAASPVADRRDGPITAEPSRLPPLASGPEYRSVNGVLDVRIDARPTRVLIGDRMVDGATYNGSYAGPVLRLRPGDTLRMHFTNHLPQITNVHFHGLGVSPKGHGDDSMRMIAPGETWDYVIPIPKDHPPGVYWFHTHGHDFAERQVMGGLSGTLVIEGFQDEVPATKPLIERLMALKEFSPSSGGKLNNVPKPSHGTIKTLNGQVARGSICNRARRSCGA